MVRPDASLDTAAEPRETLPAYEALVRSSAWLRAMPFEHVSRGVGHEQFVRRLVGERAVCEDPRLRPVPLLAFAVFADADRDRMGRTLESLLLQTGLCFRLVVAAPDGEARRVCEDVIRARLGESGDLAERFRDRVSWADGGEGRALAGSCGADGYLVCLRAGDVLHPSTVAALQLAERAAPGSDLYVWNEMVVEYGARPSVKRYIRKPRLEWFTLLHLNYVSHCFALRGALVPSGVDLGAELRRDALHRVLVMATAGRRARAATLPQYLLLRDGAQADPVRSDGEALRAHVADDLVLERPAGAPYRWVPRTRSRRISVVIPFRDQPEATCTAIRSVLAQRTVADLELILVDNRSRPESVEQVRACAGSAGRRATVRLLDYDRPFNHSAQCNLAVGASTGDVVVFLNNDAELLSPGALEQMASWSLVAGVATVGVRMIGRDLHTLVSAGVVARLHAGADFDSPVAESHDLEFAGYNRETFGNTFACAAAARRTLDAVGPLDELHFPIGYNDVDYCLRCRRAGLVHMYLGTELVRHEPGLSRGRTDELAQKLMIRERYPELASAGLYQLQSERRAALAAPAPAPRLPWRPVRRILSALRRRLKEGVGKVATR